MVMFNGMPNELWPDKKEHVEYYEVYRATKSINHLGIDDFLPWNIENVELLEHKKGLFKKLVNEKDTYAVSLFLSKNQLYINLDKYATLRSKTNTISVGKTNILYGISTMANDNGHIEYYLYDYLNNNPKDDFKIIEEVKKNAR